MRFCYVWVNAITLSLFNLRHFFPINLFVVGGTHELQHACGLTDQKTVFRGQVSPFTLLDPEIELGESG